jgi:hypothetical protein
MKTPFKIRKPYLLGAAVAAVMAFPAHAYNLHTSDAGEVNLDIEAILGTFSSQESYDITGAAVNDEGDSNWQEAYIKYGLSATRNLNQGATLYGALNLLSSGTFGDGDAGGFTSGDERKTKLEDAYLGWRSGNTISSLGENGLEFSFGRQNLSFGDGFLINGDALNFGDALGKELNRGGAYWLAARKAFDKTAVLKIANGQGLRSDIFWISSDNKAQSETELAGINVEYSIEKGTFGAMYLKGLDVNEAFGNTHRDGQDTFSLRFQGNAGVENLFLSSEFVTQKQGDDTRKDANAWYVEAGWTFAQLPWSPSVNYRYSTFEEGFDPLFFGFNRGYGTWFQGEVASNYAGPFNSETDVHHLALKASPSETLSFGALFFDFGDTAGNGSLDGQEVDLYAEWVVNEHLIVSPLLGFYMPDNAGVQIGNSDTNTYFQMIAIVPF